MLDEIEQSFENCKFKTNKVSATYKYLVNPHEKKMSLYSYVA